MNICYCLLYVFVAIDVSIYFPASILSPGFEQVIRYIDEYVALLFLFQINDRKIKQNQKLRNKSKVRVL